MAVLHSYERAADLFAAGVLDPRIFITDRLPLDRYTQAVTAFRAGRGLKTQIIP
jgi:threonine dehydrogenase-like Zn-dependent dehydrogenase